MTALAIPADLQPVEPAYRNALRARAAVFWVPVFFAALVVDQQFLAETAFSGLLPALIGAIGLSAIMVAPDRIYRRLGYAIDGRLLRTVRGWLFHTDTVVPVRPRPAYRRHPRAVRQDVRNGEPGRPHRRHP